MPRNKSNEHRKKLRVARRMMTPEEIKSHVSPFESKWWTIRAEQKARKLEARTKIINKNK